MTYIPAGDYTPISCVCDGRCIQTGRCARMYGGMLQPFYPATTTDWSTILNPPQDQAKVDAIREAAERVVERMLTQGVSDPVLREAIRDLMKALDK